MIKLTAILLLTLLVKGVITMAWVVGTKTELPDTLKKSCKRCGATIYVPKKVSNEWAICYSCVKKEKL